MQIGNTRQHISAWTLAAALLLAAPSPVRPAYEKLGAKSASKPASKPARAPLPKLPSKLADRIVARVNSNAITLSEVEESVMRQRMSEPEPANKKLRDLYEEELNGLIDEELLFQAAERQNIEAPEEIVATQVEETLNDIEKNFGSPEAFHEELGKYGLTVEKIKNSLRKREEREIKIVRAVSARFRVTDAEAQAYAEELKKKGESVESYRLRHILILCPADASAGQVAKARERAIEAAAVVHDGMPFDKAAKKFSEDSETSGKGGELGYVEQNAMMPALAEAVKNLKIGELSQPARSDTGYHVLQLIDKRTPRKALYGKRFIEERKKWLLQLHRTETIETQMEFLDLLPE